MQGSNRKILRNTLFLYIRMGVVMLITLYTTRALLSVLGVEDYGLYNVVCGFVAMFGFLNTSMTNGVQRFYNYELGKCNSNGISVIYTHSVVIQMILALVILVLIETVGLWYVNNKMVIPDGRLYAAHWIFQFSMISLFCLIITVPYSSAIMAYEKMDYYAVISILDAVLKLVIVLLIPYITYDRLIWYAGLISFISIVNFLLNYIYCRRCFQDVKIVKCLNKETFVSMLSFSGWNVFGSFAHMFRNQGVNLVLNFFWGTITNAAYAIAGQVSSAVEGLTQNLLIAVRPQMIKRYAAGEEDYLVRMTYSISKLTFYLVMIFAIPLVIEMSTVLDVWLGKGHYPADTVIFCQLSILMTLFNSFASPISIVVHATGEMKKFQIVCSIVILSIVPIAYVAARLGASAPIVLVLSIVVVVITQFVRLVLIRELVNFSIRLYIVRVCWPTIRVFAIVLGLTASLHLLLPNTIFCSFIVMFSSVCFTGLFIFLFGLDKKERSLFLSFVKRKYKN